MGKVFKKILFCFLISICFFKITNVYAKILTIDEVETGFNESEFIKSLGTEAGIFARENSSLRTLDVYSGDEKVFSFDYGDDYIEFNNQDFVMTEDQVMDSLFPIIMIYGVLESVLTLNGYNLYNNNLISLDEYVNNFDKYGLIIENEKYSFSGENWSSNGEYAKYFKISLDTDKINNLINDYTKEITDNSFDDEFFHYLTPYLSVGEVTATSVTLTPVVNYSEVSFSDSDSNTTKEKYMCEIYRSNVENGTYTKISDRSIDCVNRESFTDNNVESGVTYYYKAKLENGTEFSYPAMVTTLHANNSSDRLVENPKTGISLPTISVSLLLITCISAVIFMKKKTNIFKQI